MKVAIITGASSGMGKCFVKDLDKYFDVDEIYVIARRKEALDALQQYTKAKVISFAYDLTDRSSFVQFSEYLKIANPDVRLLINCAGFGKFESFKDSSFDINSKMIDLNCNALQAMTKIILPYLSKGSRVIEMASMSSIQPVPYINIYGATKAFVLSFSRALNVELKKDNIHVMALLPFWVKTEFFDIANKNEVIKYFDILYTPEFIIEKAYKEVIKKHPKDICVPGKYARMQYRLVKILPHRLVMKIWLKKEKIK